MTLSRIGLGATLSFAILTVWLGACDGTTTEGCGINGNLTGSCQAQGDGGDGCPSGSTFLNTTDSPAGSCPETYVCCVANSGSDAGTPPAAGTGSGSGS